MRHVPQRDTKPEMLLRQALHRLGLRYRVNRRPLAALSIRADVVFAQAKVAVFVDGCFWHRCPIHASWPSVNQTWWRMKIDLNWERDREVDDLLEAEDWLCLRIWSHEGARDAAAHIREVVKARLISRSHDDDAQTP